MSVLNVLATWLSLHAEQRVDFIQEIADQELIHIGVRLSPTNLFHSLNLWCKDLVPQKRGKGIAVSEFNVLATGGLYTRDGWLRAGPLRSQTVTQQIPSLVLNLWSKDLVPQKRGKGIVVSELIVLATELS